MSSFGRFFRVTTFGESHCKGVGCIVDGVPPQLELTEEDIQPQLTRRRPGQSKVATERNEKDRVTIMSGTEKGVTLGTPIGLFVPNEDQRPGDYKEMSQVPRPSHADYTYQMKYGIRASSGGGRSSARETIGRVAAGAIAEKWLKQKFGVEIVAFVTSAGTVDMPEGAVDLQNVKREEVDVNMMRCPHQETAEQMINAVVAAREEQNSIGGILTCVCRGVPVGWGEPCFDKMEALLAHAMLSIPATKGFDIGSGFAGTRLKGNVHNDAFVKRADGTIGTATNNSGGIQGGISNSEPIVFKVAFKPPATIAMEQQTCDFKGNDSVLAAKGRHDPCVVPRAVSIVETMTALVLADVALAQLSREASII
eukprot:Nk52_evm15s1020 gene=Nk52_evmTU15s1020